MKRKDLERALHEMGWQIVRHGSCHDVWASDGDEITVPRHNKIEKYTAKMILKIAKEKMT
jgi:predicted RNA binding protein YcfA (HicA-like mRNA interferase family)